MKDFISQKQVAQNLKKYNLQSFDKDIHEKINRLHHNVIEQEFKQHQKQQKQQGGRIAMPIEYYGSTTDHYSTSTPQFTNITPTPTFLRPAIPLNDLTGVLGTEKGMSSGMVGGNKQQFQVSQKCHEQSAREFLKEHHDSTKFKVSKKQFMEDSKQKFENVMNKVLSKAAKSSKQGHLSNEEFDKVLKQKQFKSFKA
jgi:ABC-type oligopeptide transport system substrate-binding subunit